MRMQWKLGVAAALCVAGALGTWAPSTRAGEGSSPSSESDRLKRLEQENAELRKRLDALEAKSAQDLSAPAAQIPSKTLEFLGQTAISGFVSASYFYDFNKPADGSSDGLTWTQNHNSFTLNKVKLTLDNPVEASPDNWDAGYNVMLIFGQDAGFVNTFGNGNNGDIRQAYVALNVPVGNGVVVKAGQLISLLNFESGDGGVANPNFTQGNQWFFTGNGPSTGLQLGYAFNEKWSTTVRVQNRMFGAQDNNYGKTFMGNINFAPDKKTGLTLIGFTGAEGSGNDLFSGVQLLASRKLSDKNNVNVATELTYMNWDGASFATPGDDATAYSAGIWLWGDFTEKCGLALRADWVDDQDGAFTSGLLGFPVNTGQELASVTLTLNLRPVAGLKIQPEIRYDHTTLTGGFDGKEDRFTAGVGVSYMF